MSFIMLGIDFHKAPIDVRGSYSFERSEFTQALHKLNNLAGVLEAVILSTCNRTELYFELDEEDIDERDIIGRIIHWWQEHRKIQDQNIRNYLIIRSEQEAVCHLMRLCCGLGSMILGEPQIFGQIKDSFSVAQSLGTVASSLNRVFQNAFAVAKKVRFATAVGQCPVSVAFSAVSIAKENCADLKDKNVLIIGAGVTATLVGKHLKTCLPNNIWICNRTLEKTKILAQSVDGEAFPLDELSSLIEHADVIVSATGMGELLISKAMLETNNQEKILVDLSVPRSIDPTINELSNITFYCVDDIELLIQTSQETRKKAAVYAERMIQQYLERYLESERAAAASKDIIAIRDHTEQIVAKEIAKSLKKLENGSDPKQVLHHFAHNLKNKWLHAPSTSMAKASAKGRPEVIDFAKELFGLSVQGK